MAEVWFMVDITIDNRGYEMVPRCSMHGVFADISLKHCPDVGKYSIRGAPGVLSWDLKP